MARGRPKRNQEETKVEETKVETVKPEVTKKIEEKVEKPIEVKQVEVTTSESFLEDFPKAGTEEEKVTSEVNKDKPVDEKKVVQVAKTTEYPASCMPVIAQLKKKPGYSRLSDSALLRIASAKLRSKYFFK